RATRAAVSPVESATTCSSRGGPLMGTSMSAPARVHPAPVPGPVTGQTCHTAAVPENTTESPAVVAVVGATATGKSDLGVALAQRLGGEVINADAAQLYRGMDIGTAKLTPRQRRGVVHH